MQWATRTSLDKIRLLWKQLQHSFNKHARGAGSPGSRCLQINSIETELSQIRSHERSKSGRNALLFPLLFNLFQFVTAGSGRFSIFEIFVPEILRGSFGCGRRRGLCGIFLAKKQLELSVPLLDLLVLNGIEILSLDGSEATHDLAADRLAHLK